MTQASEVLFEDTDVDILQQIRVPDDAAVDDVAVVEDPGGGAPLRFTTKPLSDIAGGPFIPYSEKGAANGVATLGSDGKLPLAQVPLIAINDVFNVASEAAMLALTAQTGDMARRTDLSNKMFVLAGTGDPTVLDNWLEISAGVASTSGTRTVTTLTTAAIAAGGQATGTLTLAKGTVLWGVKETNLHKCRLRVYGESAARDADVVRATDIDAVAGSYPAGTGISVDLLLDANTSYALDCDPKPILGDPDSPSPTTTMYWTVDNLTTDALPISLELHHTPFE